MKKITLLFSTLLLSGGLLAQTPISMCGTDILFNERVKKDPSLLDKIAEEEIKTQKWIAEHPYTEPANKSGGATYIVPVVFHVLHDNGVGNIPKENILDQIRLMNEDFQQLNSDISTIVSSFQGVIGNASVEFRLARKDGSGNCTDGIVRYNTTRTYDATMEGLPSSYWWSTSKYMNVFVVHSIGLGPSGGGTVAGYTQTPSSGANWGIMMNYSYIGSKPPSSLTKGRTLTHEAGHWFNLQHLWGSTNEPNVSSNCNYDDYVSDTPNTIGWQSCNTAGESCGSLDNVQNFLEYSFCSKMFTKGQVSRMQSAINSYRSTLVSSSNLAATGVDQTQPPCKPIADFSATTQVVCTGSPVEFTDDSWNADPTTWSWSFTGGTPSSSTDSMPSVTYSTPGIYTVTLTSGTTTGNSSPETKTNYIEVRDGTAKHSGMDGYEEDFGGTNFADDWIVEDDGGVKWEKYTSAGFNSSECVRLNNSSSSSQTGDIDAFISSGIDVAGMPGSPRVYFKAAYKRSATDDNDGLKVYYSTNCGEKWTVRKTLGGAALSSTASTGSSSWTPSGDSDWKEHFMTIGGGTSSDNVWLKFEFTVGETKGNNVFIDAINVYDPNSIEEDKLMDHTNLLVFPNPVEDNSIITFELFDKHAVNLSIYDVVGREVATLVNNDLNMGGHEYKIGNMDLPAGIYHVQLNVDGRRFSQKLIVK